MPIPPVPSGVATAHIVSFKEGRALDGTLKFAYVVACAAPARFSAQ